MHLDGVFLTVYAHPHVSSFLITVGSGKLPRTLHAPVKIKLDVMTLGLCVLFWYLSTKIIRVLLAGMMHVRLALLCLGSLGKASSSTVLAQFKPAFMAGTP